MSSRWWLRPASHATFCGKFREILVIIDDEARVDLVVLSDGGALQTLSAEVETQKQAHSQKSQSLKSDDVVDDASRQGLIWVKTDLSEIDCNLYFWRVSQIYHAN